MKLFRKRSVTTYNHNIIQLLYTCRLYVILSFSIDCILVYWYKHFHSTTVNVLCSLLYSDLLYNELHSTLTMH